MGTLRRAVLGLAVFSLSVILLLLAAGELYRAYQEAGTGAANTRTPKERAYSVHVATLSPETVTPVITTYGRLASGRTLDVRSSVAGPLIELSDNFKDGGKVSASEVLFRIDPARLETSRALAESDLREAEADLGETQSALALARLEEDAAQTQRDVRAQAADRQKGLSERGVITAAELESAVLALAAADQTLVNRKQVVAADEARVAQAEITVERRKIALQEATRAVADATVTAPFDGVMANVSAALGRLVSANEQLGELIDPSLMEVAFRVTNTQFGRLLNDQGALRKVDLTIVLQTGRNQVEVAAKLDRAGAEVGEGQIGRLIYARLVDADPGLVRPGDFVTVKIPERPLSDVARIPASAATADGRILVIGASNRLEEVTAKLLRQQGDELIVTDVPFGSQYVTARALQLGPGIQVTPVATTENTATAAPAAPAAPETIALDDARRAALVAFIEGNEQMKPETKARVLEELKQPEVPRATVEKYEAKMAEQQ